MKKISSMEITGLFGRYNYLLEDIDKKDLCLLYGANGCGKTTILKILSLVSELKIANVYNVDFETIKITYNDNSFLEFIKGDTRVLKMKDGRTKVKTIEIPKINADYDEYIRKEMAYSQRHRDYVHMPHSFIRRKHIGEHPIQYIVYNQDADIEHFEKFLIDFTNKEDLDFLDSLKRFKSSCKLILADRLITVRTLKNHSEREQSVVHGLENIIKQINEEVVDAAEKYSQLSQEKDSSYVKRLIRTYENKDEIVVFNKIEKLKKRIDKLVSLGISTDAFNEDYSKTKINKGILHALDMYCDDTNEKLNTYKELEEKLTSFFRLINLLFEETQKEIKVNNNKIEIYDKVRNSKIDINMLSSGEKHQTILLGDIIFNCSKSDLILIDEPEISLHVKWQESFIDNIIEIVRKNGVNLMIATHSPFVMNKYWGYAQKLGFTKGV